MAWFFLSRNYWSSSDYDLMTSIWENTISILAGNLNSGRSISYYSCKFMFSPLNCLTLSSVVRKFSLPKWTEQLLLLSLMCRFRWMARLKKEHVPTWCTRTQMSINNASTPSSYKDCCKRNLIFGKFQSEKFSKNNILDNSSWTAWSNNFFTLVWQIKSIQKNSFEKWLSMELFIDGLEFDVYPIIFSK